jgi:DNA gyrase subunit A
MGRHTRGVRGILLKDGDTLVGLDIVPQIRDKNFFHHLLVITENGIGKRSDVYLYPLQKRGGVGVKVANLTSKTGKIAAAQVVQQDDETVIFISKKAVTINLPLKNIPVLSRNTKGVILMRLKTDDDKVNAMTILEKADKETL